MAGFDEGKTRYLEMIQGVVARMASNSFALKSWTVTLVAGILALSGAVTNKRYAFIAFVPIVIFWFLDTYYLQLERKYRALFNFVRETQNVQIDFSLDLDKARTVITIDRKLKFFACFRSKTEWTFYVPMALIVVAALLFI